MLAKICEPSIARKRKPSQRLCPRGERSNWSQSQISGFTEAKRSGSSVSQPREGISPASDTLRGSKFSFTTSSGRSVSRVVVERPPWGLPRISMCSSSRTISERRSHPVWRVNSSSKWVSQRLKVASPSGVGFGAFGLLCISSAMVTPLLFDGEDSVYGSGLRYSARTDGEWCGSLVGARHGHHGQGHRTDDLLDLVTGIDE